MNFFLISDTRRPVSIWTGGCEIHTPASFESEVVTINQKFLKMNILLTGHSGFVGLTLSHTLVAAGHSISAISRSTSYDLCEFDVAKRLPLSDVIVHLAGLVGVEESWKFPDKFIRLNCDSTIAIAEYARINKLPVIFLSSFMYGTTTYLPIDENHPVS